MLRIVNLIARGKVAIVGFWKKRRESDIQVEISSNAFDTNGIKVKIISAISQDDIPGLMNHPEIKKLIPGDYDAYHRTHKGAELVIKISEGMSFKEAVRKVFDVIAGAFNTDYAIS